MGYCIFNNIAIAAKHALENRGLKRVAIVDYDVHHGNGTQQAFYDDDRVLFISLHQDSNYPIGSGEFGKCQQCWCKHKSSMCGDCNPTAKSSPASDSSFCCAVVPTSAISAVVRGQASVTLHGILQGARELLRS